MTSMTQEREITDYVRTGCSSLTLQFDEETEQRMRGMFVRALGRDCVCEEGKGCPLFPADFGHQIAASPSLPTKSETGAIGLTLALACEVRGVSIEDAATAMRVSVREAGRVLRGEKPVLVDSLGWLCDSLGISPAAVIAISGC
ncbi:MAG: hypothetical protein ACXVXP_06220 [Mycobacteriaceae bacterium]